MPVLLIFIFLFLFSLAGTIIAKKVANKKRFFDIPNSRSLHRKPTPKGGGAAVVTAWFTGLGFGYFVFHSINPVLFLAFVCSIPVAIVSLLDDLSTISQWIRLIVQILSAAAALFFLGGLSKVDCGFFVFAQPVLLNIICVFGIVWFTNLFNFIDGIDGYLGSEVLFVCISVFLLSGFEISLFLAAATAGFLFLNWQPAKIFMGDLGSSILGFTIAIFAIYCQNIGKSSIILWLMLTSVFWFDATITLFRRVVIKENIFKAHKNHAYQRIVQYGFSHQRTVISAMAINCIIFILAFLTILFPEHILLFFFLNMSLLSFVLYLVDRRFPFKK